MLKRYLDTQNYLDTHVNVSLCEPTLEQLKQDTIC